MTLRYSRGSGIWSYTFRRAGAILLVSVPDMIIISACLGLARKTTPSLSWSYRAAAICIISTAQHARPNVSGHIELCLPQLAILSNVVKAYSAPIPDASTALWEGSVGSGGTYRPCFVVRGGSVALTPVRRRR